MRPIDADALISFIDMGHLRNPLEACYSERDVVDMLESRPSLTLDDLRPQGRWIVRGGRRYCSNCGERACVTRDREDFWYTTATKFCSECGADMRGGGEDA